MDLRNRFLVLLLVVLSSYLVNGQTSDDTIGITNFVTSADPENITTANGTDSPLITTTPIPTTTPVPATTTVPTAPQTSGCANPNDFPLFGPSSCISRSSYTGIFLSSIIISCLSLLLLIGLLALYCRQRSRRAQANDHSDDEMGVYKSPRASRNNAARSTSPNKSAGRRRRAKKLNSGPSVSPSRVPYTASSPVSPSSANQRRAQVSEERPNRSSRPAQSNSCSQSPYKSNKTPGQNDRGGKSTKKTPHNKTASDKSEF